jgi:GNAT superfamily N-acetyltransferase
MLGSVRPDDGLASPQAVGAATQALCVHVDDVEAHFDRTRSAGARITCGPQATDFGSREYHVRDVEGHPWTFGTYRPAVDGAGAREAVVSQPAATMPRAVVERLIPPVADCDLRALAVLLVDAVESGAAVSFLAPLTVERAEDWWRKTVVGARSGAIFLVAREVAGIVGTVQLQPAWAPNQPHRAEIAKLLVHRGQRRTGLGRQLMRAIEDAARRSGFSLLTLDAKRGAAAERVYRSMGWTCAGTIPRYALDPDGTPHDAVIFYKELERVDP